MAVVLVTTADFDLNTPADDNDVLVVDTNSFDVTAGLDQKGDDYASLTTAEGFNGNLGAPGSYLRYNANVTRIQGGGDVWLASDDNNVAGDDAQDDVVIECSLNTAEAHLKTESAVQATCVWQRVHCNRGVVNVEETVVFGTGAIMTVGHVTDRATDSTLKLVTEASGGTALPNLEVTAGQVWSERTVTRCTITNARMTQDTKPCTTLVIGEGAEVTYNHTVGTDILVKAGGHLIIGARALEKTITRITVLEGGKLTGYVPALHVGTLLDFRRSAA